MGVKPRGNFSRNPDEITGWPICAEPPWLGYKTPEEEITFKERENQKMKDEIAANEARIKQLKKKK